MRDRRGHIESPNNIIKMNVAKKIPISIKKKLKCRMTNENSYFALVLVGHRVKMFYSR